MSFPSDHRWPSELPALLLAGHAFQDQGVTEEPVAFERGEDRQRPRYTFNPLIVSVGTVLNQAQFDRFCDWYEDELQAGGRAFDVRVAKQGGARTAREWWAAQFVGPPRYEAKHRGFWRVTAELLLRDGPYDTRTAPTLRGLVASTSQLIAAPVIDTVLRGLVASTSELTGRPAPFSLRALVDGTSEVTGYLGEEVDVLLLEGGSDYLLLEGGTDRILLEP